MARIIDAIHSSVPEELWPEILRKIDGPVAADSPADEFEDGDDAEDEYEPVNPRGQTRTGGLSARERLTTPSKRISAPARGAPFPSLTLR